MFEKRFVAAAPLLLHEFAASFSRLEPKGARMEAALPRAKAVNV